MPADPTFDRPDDARPGCPLCQTAGGLPVWQDAQWRVIRAEEAGYPAWYRVILHPHRAAFSELSPDQGRRCMALVAAVEATLIRHLQPTRTNLAALGNLVPHLHWHVIARFDWDGHFPQPVWGERQRPDDPSRLAALSTRLGELDVQLALALQRV